MITGYFRPALLLGAALWVASTGAFAAGVYKWSDSEGNVHYTQTPPPEGGAEKMTPPPPAPKALPQERPAPTPAAAPAGDKAAEDRRRKEREAEIARQNCETARKNLDIYTTSRRLLTEEGEAIILDDDVREAKIREANENIKKYCQ